MVSVDYEVSWNAWLLRVAFGYKDIFKKNVETLQYYEYILNKDQDDMHILITIFAPPKHSLHTWFLTWVILKMLTWEQI